MMEEFTKLKDGSYQLPHVGTITKKGRSWEVSCGNYNASFKSLKDGKEVLLIAREFISGAFQNLFTFTDAKIVKVGNKKVKQ